MDATTTQTVILGLRVHSGDGVGLMKLALREFTKVLKPVSISSVYLVRAEDEFATHVHDLHSQAVFEGLVLAIKGFTELPATELNRSIKQVEEQLRRADLRQSVTAIVYFYGSQTLMTPELTLPEPSFHMHAESVLPAAEIAPELQHPVLKKTLRELAHPFVSAPWGEFVAQGKAMLDF